MLNEAEYLLAHSRPEGACRVWSGPWPFNTPTRMPRVGKELAVLVAVRALGHREAPTDKHVSLSCGNKQCINPDHAEFGEKPEDTAAQSNVTLLSVLQTVNRIEKMLSIMMGEMPNQAAEYVEPAVGFRQQMIDALNNNDNEKIETYVRIRVINDVRPNVNLLPDMFPIGLSDGDYTCTSCGEIRYIDGYGTKWLQHIGCSGFFAPK